MNWAAGFRGGRGHVSVGLVLILLITAVRSEAAPVDLLKKALQGPSHAYEGIQETKVFGDAEVSTSRVSVRADGKGAVRREFLSGPAAGVVVIQHGTTTWQRQAKGGFVRLPGGVSGTPGAAAAAIARNYLVTAHGGLRFLNRKATEIRILARQTFNPSRTMLVDDATGLILRDITTAPGGEKRSQTEFVSLAFQPQPATLFQIPATSGDQPALTGPASFEVRTSAAAVVADTGRSVPVPGHIPSGYSVSAYGVMRTGSGLKTPAVRYSDGLASFTIFVHGRGPGMGFGPGWGGRRGPMQRRRGAGPWGPPGRAGELITDANRQRAVVTYTSQTAAYILVGDIAATELERVAKSLP